MIHIAPSRCTGREIEDYKVALVLGSSFIGPDNGTVYVETLIRAVILDRFCELKASKSQLAVTYQSRV